MDISSHSILTKIIVPTSADLCNAKYLSESSDPLIEEAKPSTRLVTIS